MSKGLRKWVNDRFPRGNDGTRIRLGNTLRKISISGTAWNLVGSGALNAPVANYYEHGIFLPFYILWQR